MVDLKEQHKVNYGSPKKLAKPSHEQIEHMKRIQETLEKLKMDEKKIAENKVKGEALISEALR